MFIQKWFFHTCECFSSAKIMAVKYSTLEITYTFHYWNSWSRKMTVGNNHGVEGFRYEFIIWQIFHRNFPFAIFNGMHTNNIMIQFDMFVQIEIISIRMKESQYVSLIKKSGWVTWVMEIREFHHLIGKIGSELQRKELYFQLDAQKSAIAL